VRLGAAVFASGASRSAAGSGAAVEATDAAGLLAAGRPAGPRTFGAAALFDGMPSNGFGL
jgi:hypothetical protein